MSTNCFDCCWCSSASCVVPFRFMRRKIQWRLAGCDLARNPKAFDGKLIRVRGTLNVHFEDFSFGNRNCDSEQGIWLAFGGDVPGIVSSTANDSYRKSGSDVNVNGVSYGIKKDDNFRKLYALIAARHGDEPAFNVTATLTGMFFAGQESRTAKGAVNFAGYGGRPLLEKRASGSQAARIPTSSDEGDVRSTCLDELRDIGAELRWFEEENKDRQASEIGSSLHALISDCRRQTRVAVREHTAALGVIHQKFEDVERAAKADLPNIQEIASCWVDAATVEKWQRLSLDSVRRQFKVARKRPKSGVSRDPRKTKIADIKRRYAKDAGDNEKLCRHLDFEGVSVAPVWGKSTWLEAWNAGPLIRRKVSRYLSGIHSALERKSKAIPD